MEYSILQSVLLKIWARPAYEQLKLLKYCLARKIKSKITNHINTLFINRSKILRSPILATIPRTFCKVAIFENFLSQCFHMKILKFSIRDVIG
jgi:hypothetical protein